MRYQDPYEDQDGGIGIDLQPPGPADPGMEWQWTGTDWIQVPSVQASAPPPETQQPPPTTEQGPPIDQGGPIDAGNPYETRTYQPGPFNPYEFPAGYQAPPGDPTGSDVGIPGLDPNWQQNLPPGYKPPPGSDFTWPEFTPPAYTEVSPFAAPAPFQYQPFAFDAFQAPSYQDAINEPGYAFARDEGRKALEQSAAARGVLRTGGTLKDLLKWGDQFGAQNYQNVYNRAADTYDRNFNAAYKTWAGNHDNAADAYTTNYNASRDVWDRNRLAHDTTYQNAYTAAKDVYGSKFDVAKINFDDLYKRWRDLIDTQTKLATMTLPGD